MGGWAGLPPSGWLGIGIPCDIPDLHGLALDLSGTIRSQGGGGPNASLRSVRGRLLPGCDVLAGSPRNYPRIHHVMGDSGGSMVDAILHLSKVENRSRGLAKS